MSSIADWQERVSAAWDEAAEALVAQGYRIYRMVTAYPAVFVRGEEQVVLVRMLGQMNWHPRRIK